MSLAIPGLTDDEQRTLNLMLDQLAAKARRNIVRARYFDGKNVLRDMGISLPPQVRRIETVVGWPNKGVRALSKRCNFDGFVIPGGSVDDLGITSMWTENNMDVDAPQAQESAFIHASAFIITTLGDPALKEPEVLITCRDALSGTGIWDPRRRVLSDFLSIIAVHEDGNPSELVMYIGSTIVTCRRVGTSRWEVTRSSHNLGRPPVEILAYRPRLGRPFGTSRITRSVMSITDSAVRSILRSEVTAEFYSAPQRYALGVDSSDFVDGEGNPVPAWQTIIGRMLAIGRDENDLVPEVGQFPQMTMQPHTDQLRAWATMFAGEMDLPVSSMGIVQDNPASAEAIYAAKEELVTEAEASNLVFGAAWRRSALNGWQLREKADTVPAEIQRLRAKFRDPATPSRSSAADAVVKMVGAGVLPADSEVTYEQLGYDETTIARLVADKTRLAARQTTQALATAGAAARSNSRVADLMGRSGVAQ